MKTIINVCLGNIYSHITLILRRQTLKQSKLLSCMRDFPVKMIMYIYILSHLRLYVVHIVNINIILMSRSHNANSAAYRFFLSSPPHRKTTFFKQLETTNAPLNESDIGDTDSDCVSTMSLSCNPPDGSSRRQSQPCTRSPFSSFNFSKFSRSQNSPCGSTASTACFTPVKPSRLPCAADNDTFSETDTFSEPDQVSVLEASEAETLNGALNGDGDLLASQRTSLYSIDTDDVEFSLLESDVSSQQSVDSPSMLSATTSFSRTDSQPRSLLDKSRKCQSVSSFFEKQGQFSYASERVPSMGDPCTVGSSQGSGISDRVRNE